MIKVFIFFKRIHRLLALLVASFGIVMMITGMSMKYGWFVDPLTARSTHNLFSTFFVIALLPMMITGLFMFIFPYWQRYISRRRAI